MTRAYAIGALLAALALWGCQQPDMGQPLGDAKRLADLEFAPTPKTPPAGFAMGAATPAEIAAESVNRTAAILMEDGCEHRHYRTIGGRMSGETICGDTRYLSTGTYRIRDDGADCVEWDNPDWDDGCYSWEHLGDGRYRFEAVSGPAQGASGESRTFIGNIFDL